jgi:hypothetical protein
MRSKFKKGQCPRERPRVISFDGWDGDENPLSDQIVQWGNRHAILCGKSDEKRIDHPCTYILRKVPSDSGRFI